MKWHTPDWSIVTVAGPDATKLLHHLCTNNVGALGVGDSCEAFFTDVKAHVLAHAIVCRAESALHVVVTSPRAEQLAEHLDRYHIREDLTLAVDAEKSCALAFGAGDVRAASITSFPLAGLGRDARLVLGSAPSLDEHWSEQGAIAETLSPEDFEELRIEHGFPLDAIDVSERNLPQEVNRDALAISFTKGCYLGQETVARIDALGHVNRLLMSVRFDGSTVPPAGAALRGDGADVGAVTSACVSPRLGAPLALAYVRRGHNDAGARLESDYGSATVLSGPGAAR